MKTLVAVMTLFSGFSANAGYFVEKSLYSPQFLLIGRGNTLEQSRRDALAALPAEKNGVHFELDAQNSPANQCTEGGSPDPALLSCGAAVWQTTIPLIRVER